MIQSLKWTDVGHVVRALTLAGPSVSPTGAAATVARLKRAVRWSEPLLADLSDLPEAAEQANSRETLIVDRRATVDLAAELVERFLAGTGETLGPGAWGTMIVRRPGPLGFVGAGLALHALAPRVKGMWDPFDQRRILVAPNVLEAAERGALDQIDYCKWVALRSGLWGIPFQQAPWLAGHMSHLARQMPSTTGEFVSLVQLLDALVSTQMDALTPQDIPSVGWIRANAPEPAGIFGLRALRHIGIPVADIERIRARSVAFARVVIDAGAVPTLLRSADYLPTVEEVDHPQSWVDRVGL